MNSEKKTGIISILFSRFNIIGILLLSLLLAVLFFAQDIDGEILKKGAANFFYKSFLYNLIYTSVIWLGSVTIIYILDLRLPWRTHVWSRLGVQTLAILSFASLANIYLCDLINLMNQTPIISKEKLWNNLVVSWIATIFMNLLWAGIYFFREWKKSLLETEILKKEQLRTQYELLKNQVNPHFLFNALNTLAALIPEDPAKAEDFVVNMADVYRYVLTARDQDTVSLEEELKHLNAFIFLNQMRFGDNLKIEWKGLPGKDSLRLIPMALQLLVENAIKHNEISKKHPLTISISIEEKGVWVVNPIRKKLTVQGTGTGLKNLELRYQGTGDGIVPQIFEDNDIFRVFVPFIEK